MVLEIPCVHNLLIVPHASLWVWMVSPPNRQPNARTSLISDHVDPRNGVSAERIDLKSILNANKRVPTSLSGLPHHHSPCWEMRTTVSRVFRLTIPECHLRWIRNRNAKSFWCPNFRKSAQAESKQDFEQLRFTEDQCRNHGTWKTTKMGRSVAGVPKGKETIQRCKKTTALPCSSVAS